ncbi:MAG TPA: GIY-YIG nuclease family protein [Bryobacteraceae bacterium]|nr:GIY-YIG nuclease family protein [Bryobacteraceae bacterium]
MADPFTIRIFVPDEDPEGVRLIDRMNWTGLGVAFPRTKWSEVRQRPEFIRAGVYILVGYQDDDLPTIYIGQADGVRNRIENHYQNKDFWDWGIIFVSNSGGLNRAHVTWLEYALMNRATATGRCRLDNGNAPQEPGLTEAEKADTQAFFKEILQILPLVGLRAFEFPKAVATPKTSTIVPPQRQPPQQPDTIIVPAKKDGFERVFLGENCWHAIRISGGMLDKIKYIAAYQSLPVQAITHYAPVDRIEPYGEGGKYKVVFSEKAKAITPIPIGDAPPGTMQGPRYTTLVQLLGAKKVTDLTGRP